MNNDKKNFKFFCDELIKSYPYRTDTINQKKEYIIRENILNLYKYELSCPMESQISHNHAYLLSSRPKGYSLKMLDKILKIRLLFKNKENIKQLYLNNFNIKETIDYKKVELNFDILDKYNQLIPYYKDKIFNPSIGQYYSYNNL